jgi:hypothetical protein
MRRGIPVRPLWLASWAAHARCTPLDGALSTGCGAGRTGRPDVDIALEQG